jgi:integrase
MAARQTTERTRHPGIYRVHARGCGWKAGTRCKCKPCYQASVYSARERKEIRKHFSTEGAARTWRQDAAGAVRSGRMRAPTTTTVAQAAERLTAGLRDGSIYDRSGRPYKPSTVRSYKRALEQQIVPEVGHKRLSALERRDVHALVETGHAAGAAPSTIQNRLNPLQVLCRRALRDGDLTIDPTDGLELPAIRGGRDRIASPDQAEKLIAALPIGERAFWACAFYAGLRRGELRALRFRDVDFAAKVIRVERGWDDEEGEIDVKSDAGRRTVPLAGPLRSALAAHKLATGRDGEDLVFGREPRLPFIPSTVRSRALKAWKAVKPEPLESLTPHEARHCCASYLIAAGLDAKRLSVYMGHADIRVTYNRYGHLMPGSAEQDAEALGAFLDGHRHTAAH